MENEKNEVMETEIKEVATMKTKKSFKQKLADRKMAKQVDKARKEELKLDLLKNPENPEERQKEIKEITKRQLKRAVVPAAIVAGAAAGTIVAVAKASGGNETSSEETIESTEE